MISPLPSSLRSQRGIGLLQVIFVLLFFTITLTVSTIMMEPLESSRAAVITEQRLKTLKSAITRYRQDNGSNPTDLDGLLSAGVAASCVLDTNPSSATYRQLRRWCGPYLSPEFPASDLFKRDGWNVLLQYNGNTLVSCGANRSCGDTDDISLAL